MMLRKTTTYGLAALAFAGVTVVARVQGAETFTATAAVKTAAGATGTAPVTIVVERKMSQAEADKFTAAFKTGGAAALRKALVGVPPTGSVKIGAGAAVPTRLTLERRTDVGRLLTIVTDTPLAFVGAGAPGAKSPEGHDFGIIDLEIRDKGASTGVIAPAAKVSVNNQGAFVVSDYSGEYIRLTEITKGK
jgi:hypothetical protein